MVRVLEKDFPFTDAHFWVIVLLLLNCKMYSVLMELSGFVDVVKFLKICRKCAKILFSSRNLQGRPNLSIDKHWFYLSSGWIVVSFSSCIQGFKFHQDLIFISTKELDLLKCNFLDWILVFEQKHLNLIVLPLPHCGIL